MEIEDLEKGLKNKHYKKFEREQLIEEYEMNCIRNHQIERKAGFFDKKHNIFEIEKRINYLCPKCSASVAHSVTEYECNECGKRGELKECPISG